MNDPTFWEIFFASQAFLLLAMGFALGIFDKLINAVTGFFAWLFFTCYEVLDDYERGVILRFGKFSKTLGPGLHFILPWGIDKLLKETVVRSTSYLDVQSLTSADGKPVSVSAILIYKIKDIRKFLLDIEDGETDVQNMCYGVIADCVESSDWYEVCTKEFNRIVLDKCRRICETHCGVKLMDIKYSDKATARNVRLWND